MSSTPGVLELQRKLPVASVGTGVYALLLLSIGHFSIDLYAGGLGGLHPRLVQKLGLSLTQAGLLGGLLIFSSSVCQPLYGYLADRFHTRMFTVLAPAVAGVFISMLGVAPSYAWLLLLVVLGGAGVASFHPQASARVTHGVSVSRGRWMAVFISAGTLGMALGPTYFSWMPAWLGMERLYWAAIPGLLCTGLLWFMLEVGPSPAQKRRFDLGPLRDAWKPLTLLYFCVFVRSMIQVTYAQFIPLYLNMERGFAVTTANYVLTAYLTFGAIGGFLGGHLSDKLGGRKVIMISFLGSMPFLMLFFFSTGALSIAGLMLGGLVLLFTIPVNVVMAQDLAPAQTGTVSALMMGFAWGLAGMIFIPLTGWLSDLFTLQQTLAALALFPIAGFLLAWKLPRTAHA
jgi:FSR family fosmidomycin resistance protein-like MFS transporter